LHDYLDDMMEERAMLESLGGVECQMLAQVRLRLGV